MRKTAQIFNIIMLFHMVGFSQTDVLYKESPMPVDGVETEKSVMNKYIQKKIVLDHFFNNEINAKTGKPFHYLWTDTAMSGFSQLGELFRSKGAELTTLEAAPTAKNLIDAAVYIIVDPDTKEETLHPNYMTEKSANEIADWVKKGGVLLLMTNDLKNAELDSINILASKFGMRFNKDQLHPVSGRDWEMGASKNLPDHPLFKNVNKIYLKDISSITCTNNAKAVLAEGDHVLIATCSYGKGHVYAIGDPWIYNEYIDHRMLPESFENKKAAENLVEILLSRSE